MRRAELIDIALAVMIAVNVVIAVVYAWEVKKQREEIEDLRFEISEFKNEEKIEELRIPEEREENEYRGEYQEEIE